MRVLFISFLSPYPPHGGGAQRSNLIYRALSEVAEVDLALVEWGGELREGLRERFNLVANFVWRAPGQRFPFSWVYPLHTRLVNRAALTLLPKRLEYEPDPWAAPGVRRLIANGNYDLIVGRQLRPTLKSGCLGSPVPTILDFDDVESHVYRSRLNNPNLPRWQRWINRRHHQQTERLEPVALRRFDAVWMANDRLGGFDYLPHKVWLPNIPFPREDGRPVPPAPAPATGSEPVILFVGTLDYAPNPAAVDHFVRAVWPAVHRAEPRARFRIVGSGMAPAQRARWEAVPGVEAVGFVADLAEAYAGCRFTVVPIVTGSGTNIKVLESLAYGRTTVVSPFAHAPFAGVFRDGESLRVPASDEAFAAACLDLLRDGNQCAALAARGRELVQRHFSFDAFKTIVADSVAEVTARPREGRPPTPAHAPGR